MDDIETLKRVPIFSNMDEHEIAGVLAVMDRLTYEPGDVIMHEGEAGDLFHIVIEGHLQVLIQDASGMELDVQDVGPGGFFGELSMLTGGPRSARVKAVDNVVTLTLDR